MTIDPDEHRPAHHKLIVREGTWEELSESALSVRRAVFQREQGFASTVDEDARDVDCTHVVIELPDGTALGTTRLYENQIGRLCVLRSERGQGLGFLLVAAVLRIAYVTNLEFVWSNAQPTSLGLARVFGFTIDPTPFDVADQQHFKVVKYLKETGEAP